MNNSILEIKNLSKTYYTKDKEIKAIKNISFDVKDGDFISIVGPSGCGKSTILSILSGILKKTSGDIIYNKKIKTGYMLQEDALFPFKTVFENSCLGLEIEKKLTKENKKNVVNLLNKYGLKDFINSYPNSLSGGLKQRVALIRTLAINPDILLLDEPFSKLDYSTRLILSDELYKIIKNEKKTVIMVTHDLEEAISMASKVLVMSKRPGMIKKEIEINLDKKRLPTENRKDKKFLKYYDEIWNDIEKQI